MKDKLEQELAIGDTVVYNQDKYSAVQIGTIIAITPKRVRVHRRECIQPDTWNYCQRVKNPEDVIKVKDI